MCLIEDREMAYPSLCRGSVRWLSSEPHLPVAELVMMSGWVGELHPAEGVTVCQRNHGTILQIGKTRRVWVDPEEEDESILEGSTHEELSAHGARGRDVECQSMSPGLMAHRRKCAHT